MSNNNENHPIKNEETANGTSSNSPDGLTEGGASMGQKEPENPTQMNSVLSESVTSSEESEQPNTKGKGKGKGKGKKKMNIFAYWLLSISTFGVWSRFRPRKGGWSGSWFVSVWMLSLLCAFLIGERFYKEEINQLAKEQLQTNVDLIPEVLPFENRVGDFISKEEMKTLKESLAIKDRELQTIKGEISLKDIEIKKLKSQSLGYQEEIGALEKEVDSISVPEIQYIEAETEIIEVPIEVAPKINHSTFDIADAEVGCKTSYSTERSNDLFEQSYNGKWVNWTGVVVEVNNEYVVLENSVNKDTKVEVQFSEKGAGYYMLKDSEVSMTFKLNSQGTCEMPFKGSQGVEYKTPEAKL